MKIKCPPITGRADDRPKSILEESPEGDLALTDSVVEHISPIGVFTAELDQLPHQPIGFIYGQLIPSRDGRMVSIVAIVVNIGSDAFGGVVGDAALAFRLVVAAAGHRERCHCKSQ